MPISTISCQYYILHICVIYAPSGLNLCRNKPDLDPAPLKSDRALHLADPSPHAPRKDVCAYFMKRFYFHSNKLHLYLVDTDLCVCVCEGKGSLIGNVEQWRILSFLNFFLSCLFTKILAFLLCI